MAADIFFKIGSFKGESQDESHKEWIEVLSWNWGISNPGSMATGGGGGQGRANIQDLTFSHTVDKASYNLQKACITGEHIGEATLVQRKQGDKDGKQVEFLKIKLTDLIVSSASASGSDGGGLPMESISLNFTKIEWEYFVQDAKGAVASAGKYSFDQKLHKVA